ncbi:FtsW/RodA/SpoVE family cell cycle protein [Clostridium cylindrosporum]|uniref:Cell cycle protein, FtsW/RodA/SpoVE family n=1 Tax=Clostridium cylindrosporum DSM 605 TaxID=1121307 RepID=A0A0J8D4I8_CLOCY|nr:FtsW/RodA/SpoVE family cell cycle protein [Clostridium cylindrosporum]KMT21080.1 cell cycle protein, FtsW/RodA/SpoVE family [Clostridium cylindrosporum DSM 605]
MIKSEKSVMASIVLVTMLMFFILSISKGEFDFKAIIVGALSSILMLVAHFIVKKFYPKGDKFLLIVPAFLTQFGLVMLYRLNPSIAMKQLSWIVAGMAIYIIILIFMPDIKRFEKFDRWFIIGAVIFLVLPLLIGKEKMGARNWVSIGGFGFQPSEIAKLFIIMYLANIYKIKDKKDILKFAIPIFIGLGILVVEKDLGGVLIIFGIFTTVLYIGTSNLKYIWGAIGFFSIGGTLSYFIFNHVKRRVDIWIDPWKDKYGAGHQIVQSMFAIGTGGLFGTGLGLGNPEFVAVVESDFIFAAICEEMGMIGALAIILLYLILVYRGLRVALYARDGYARLVAVGITSMVAFQVFVIIGGVTKMIPLTGITLPLISYGGTSMLITFVALGVLQKISQMGRDIDDEESR